MPGPSAALSLAVRYPHRDCFSGVPCRLYCSVLPVEIENELAAWALHDEFRRAARHTGQAQNCTRCPEGAGACSRFTAGDDAPSTAASVAPGRCAGRRASLRREPLIFRGLPFGQPPRFAFSAMAASFFGDFERPPARPSATACGFFSAPRFDSGVTLRPSSSRSGRTCFCRPDRRPTAS